MFKYFSMFATDCTETCRTKPLKFENIYTLEVYISTIMLHDICTFWGDMRYI